MARLCVGLGLLGRPAQPYLSTFFQELPLRESDLQVFKRIQSSGNLRDGVHTCQVAGCGETYSRLTRTALHVRTAHNMEEVGLDF